MSKLRSERPLEERQAPKLPVSVCVPVRDEAANLPGCFAALNGFVDEIVVVDSGSSDGTQQLAKELGASVLDFTWNGGFPKKRNWALQNHRFKHPWILFLDADERATPEFLDELCTTLANTTHVGFMISFNNWFMGHPLRHGDVFSKLALFRIDSGEYERFPEDSWSHLDMEVHEHPVLGGTIGRISARLEHREDRGLDHYIAKHNAYAEWEMNRFRWLRQAGVEEWSKLNSRQQFKYRHLDRWWLAPLYLFASYILKRGFLDGKAGWTFAHLKWRYFSDIRRRILAAGKAEEIRHE
jgi:glycosyltransferase involved in cell wall biosynthesis